jgi:hypothetical protein
MSWITITEADVISKLSGPEIAAMKTAALQAAQTDPLPEVIDQVVKEIRGYVAACSENVLGDGVTIPEELLGAAINRIRYELATRLPVASLLTQARTDANSQALTLLRDVAKCAFKVIAPTTPSEDQAPGQGVELINANRRVASREKLSGL